MGISGEFYNLENYLSGIFQMVVLNGQTSSWSPVLAGVLQRSILGLILFLFLIYINDLPNECETNLKLFAYNTSLFHIVKEKNESANTINNGLLQISKWAYNWEMLF